MKNSELIAKLKELPPDDEVTFDDECGYWHFIDIVSKDKDHIHLSTDYSIYPDVR